MYVFANVAYVTAMSPQELLASNAVAVVRNQTRGSSLCGTVGCGPGIATVVVQITSVAWVRSLAWELPHDMGAAKKKKKIKLREKLGVWD